MWLLDGWDLGADWRPDRARTDEIRAYAQGLAATADELERLRSLFVADVVGLLSQHAWSGSAATALESVADEVAWAIGLVAEGASTAGYELARYADDLDDLLRRASVRCREVVRARDAYAVALAADGSAVLQAEADLAQAQRAVRMIVAEADALAAGAAGHLATLLDPDAGGSVAAVARVAEKVAAVSEAMTLVAGGVPVVGTALTVVTGTALATALVSRSWLAIHGLGRWSEAVPVAGTSVVTNLAPALRGGNGLATPAGRPSDRLEALTGSAPPSGIVSPAGAGVPASRRATGNGPSAPTRPLVDQAVDARGLHSRLASAGSRAEGISCAPLTGPAPAPGSPRTPPVP